LKPEGLCVSETVVPVYQTTLRRMAEDHTFYSRCRENLELHFSD